MAIQLDKHPSIIAVIKRLRSRLGRKAFVLQDHWNDLHAIGIESPFHAGLLIYISTLHQPVDHFWYELEIPPPESDNSLPYIAVGRGATKSFEKLAEIVTEHLRYYG